MLKRSKEEIELAFETFAEGCDELFVVQGSLKVETDALANLDEDASLAKVRNAFVKGNSKKKSSRVIATKLIDLIAV